MKKLIGSTINSISTSTANAVNTVSKQLDKSLAQQEQHVLPTPQSEKQYLRLPVESAKKLRWYDKSDLAQLTRQHVREKHLLLDTVTALKKVMIRAGFTDASLDDEARQLVSAAESLRLADQGTESVLLVALQDELEVLRAERTAAEQELQQLRDRLGVLEASGGSAGIYKQQLSTADGGNSLSAAEQPAAHTANAISAVPNSLATQLQHSYAALEAAVAAAAAVAEQVHQQELVLASDRDVARWVTAMAAEQQQQQQQQQVDVDAGETNHLQQHQQQKRQQGPPGANTSSAAGSQGHTSSSSSSSAGSDPVASAAIIQRYRDYNLQLEERCRASERNSTLLGARVASLEESLAVAQQTLAAKQQQAAAAEAASRQQISHLEDRVRAAEAAATAAAAAPSAGSNATVAAAADERLLQLQQQLAGATTQVSAMERRLSSAEVREAQLMAELRSLGAAAAERDHLLSQAAALREQLGELGRERTQLGLHKQRVADLEASKADLEHQLAGMAALIASSEAQHRELSADRAAALAAAEVAAAATAKAQSSVGEQVAARLAAAGHNRSMWPSAARQEVEQLEQQIEAIQADARVVRSQLEVSMQELQQEQQTCAAQHHQLQELHERLSKVEEAAAAHEADFIKTLQCCQADADELRQQLQQMEATQAAERQRSLALRRNSSVASAGLMSSGPGGIVHTAASSQPVRTSSGSGKLQGAGSGGLPGGGSSKWQEQNKVGGGSLYGVADTAVAVAARAAPASRDSLSGVDLVYVKNIVLKFLDSVVAGKAAERDALLPAIAAVLQATPQEFAAMRKVLAATAPPATQMLSVLGKLAQLTS